MNKVEWDKFSDFQKSYHQDKGHIIRQKIYNPIMFRLIGNIENKDVLDAGAGTGNFVKLLNGKPKSITLVDYSEKLLEQAKIANPEARILCQDLQERINLENESVDIIFSNIALDYVENLQVFAEESARILRDGGKLVIGVQHPFFHQEAQRIDNDRYDRKFGYFDLGSFVRRIYGSLQAVTYSKPVSFYLNLFIGADFILKNILEIGYTKGDEEFLTDIQKKEIGLPRFLFLVFEK